MTLQEPQTQPVEVVKPPKKAYVGASLLSALSGNPHRLDYRHNRIRNMIGNVGYSRNIQPFTIPVEDIPEGMAPHDTTWIKSPHGTYLMVRTFLPFNYKGTMEAVPGYALLFSQHPAYLAELFLWSKENAGKPIPAEIEAKITVVSGRYEHDIKLKNPKTGDEYLVTGWIKTAIELHNVTFRRLLKRHGSIIKDSENLLRSGSSIIWIKPSKDDPTKKDILYYGNPVFGQVSLYMREATLNSRLSKAFFHSAGIKLNEEPIPASESSEFAHRAFTKIARNIMRMDDPYSLTGPQKLKTKILRGVKKGAVRTLQKMSHSIANMNLKAFAVTAGVSGFLVILLQVPALLFAASAGKSNVLFKGAQSLVRASSKFLSPVSTVAVNALNDVAVLFASQAKNAYVTDEMRGLILNPNYIGHMRAVPSQYTANTFPEGVKYDKKHERIWAQSVILDTMGIQPGTIFSEVEINGRDFLLAEQPNGLNVYYAPEERMAFAHKVREPYEYACLEKPIQLLLDEMDEGHKFIGVKVGKNGLPVQCNFASLDDIPEMFKQSRENSLQSLAEKGFGLDLLTNPKDFPLVHVLIPSEAKKLMKKSRKEVTEYCKVAFDEGVILDENAAAPVTVEDNLDNYMLQLERQKTTHTLCLSFHDSASYSLATPCVIEGRAMRRRGEINPSGRAIRSHL